MKTRGRNSAASQLVLAERTPAPVDAIQRPDAPYDLTDEQAEEWWAIVNRMPADWFPRETHGMLAQLCRLITRARRMAQLINEMEKSKNFIAKDYREMLRTEAMLSKAIAVLSTKMRISQQSSFDRLKKKQYEITKRPWEAEA